MSRSDWNRSHLETVGFGGWVPFGKLEPALSSIATANAGVYLLLRKDPTEPPGWVAPSPVGATWRGDPSVSRAQLEANWIRGVGVVYIGKAGRGQLRRRLRAYLRFGQGRGGRHWGGRLVFQLQHPWHLLVAWRCVGELDASAIERDLLGRFSGDHDGRPPFANNPDRYGK